MKIIAIIILSFFTLVADSAFAETITVSNVGSPVSLMYHEVLKKAYEKIGIELKRKIYPGKRALKYANAGKTSGGVRIKGIEKNYPNLIMISTPVYKVKWMAVVKDKSIKVNGWESLRPYKIGIRLGIKLVEMKTKGMNVEKASDNHTILKKVAIGRNDIGILPQLAILAAIKKNNFTGLTILEPPLQTVNLYHYIHNSRKDLVEKLEKVMADMDASGEIQQIIDHEKSKKFE